MACRVALLCVALFGLNTLTVQGVINHANNTTTGGATLVQDVANQGGGAGENIHVSTRRLLGGRVESSSVNGGRLRSWWKSVTKTVKKGVETGTKTVEKGVEKGAKTVEKGVEKGASAVKKGFETLGKDVKIGVTASGKAIKTAAEAAANFVSSNAGDLCVHAVTLASKLAFDKATGAPEMCAEMCATVDVEVEALGGGPEDPVADLVTAALTAGCGKGCATAAHSMLDKWATKEFSKAVCGYCGL